jgi:biopolymer transport protein ExbD
MSTRGGHNHRRWRLSGHRKPMIDVVRNDINVTPLVDVMLVLLIIFMLMTLIMGRGHDVTLPKAENYSQEKDKLQPVVTIDIDGNLWVEKNKLGPVSTSTLKEMDDMVQGMWKAPKDEDAVGRIYLKADDKIEYSKVYPVLEYMNRQMINPANGQTVQRVDLAISKAGEDK